MAGMIQVGRDSPFSASQNIVIQSSAQVLKAINAEDAIGVIGLGFNDDDIDEWRSAPACDNVLSGKNGYYARTDS